MKKGVLFHLDLDSGWIFDLALTNIKNFLKFEESRKIAVVANGPAVKLFVESSNRKFKEDLKELHEKGVKFFICGRALSHFKISEKEIFNFCEIVPSGILQIVKLQEEGYIYIKP